MNPPSHVDLLGLYSANAKEFWELGYHEIANASPTGMAFCLFKLRDMYKNVLHVVTCGEEDPDNGSSAAVQSWWIEVPAVEIPKERRPKIAIAKAPANIFEHLGPGTPQERVKQLLGPPHRALFEAWGYKFDDALVQIAFDENENLRYIALAVTINTAPEGFLAPMLHTAIGQVTLADVLEDQSEFEFRWSLRTEEIVWQASLGPPGAWKYYTLGALWPLRPGCLPEPCFTWDRETNALTSDPRALTFNWIAISSGPEEIWFEWTLAF